MLLHKNWHFYQFSPTMADSADGLFWIKESRLLELCRVNRATWRMWSKDGLIDRDPGGAYTESAALAVVSLLALREHLSASDTALAWKGMKLGGQVDRVVTFARHCSEVDRIDLVIEPESRIVRCATDEQSLIDAVRFEDDPRAVIVLPLKGKLERVRDGFRVMQETTKRPTERRPGRPARASVPVRSIPSRSRV